MMTHVSNTFEYRILTSRERMRLSQARKSSNAGVKQKDDANTAYLAGGPLGAAGDHNI